MNWLEKIKFASKLPSNQVLNHLEQAIRNYIDGEWQTLRHDRLMPSYRLQQYGVLEMIGKNIKIEGDMYYVKIFYEVRKRPGKIEFPPGYFSDNNPPGGPWIGPTTSHERTEKERAWMSPYTKVDFYDTDIGHPLLSFRGFIEGWKGPNAPSHEKEQRLFQLKNTDPRSNMVRIGTFGNDIEEEQGKLITTENNPADTPFAVAQFIRNSIDRFFGFDGDNGHDPQYPQVPQMPYDSIESPKTDLILAQSWLRKTNLRNIAREGD